jgi:hypothetical protein
MGIMGLARIGRVKRAAAPKRARAAPKRPTRTGWLRSLAQGLTGIAG